MSEELCLLLVIQVQSRNSIRDTSATMEITLDDDGKNSSESSNFFAITPIVQIIIATNNVSSTISN